MQTAEFNDFWEWCSRGQTLPKGLKVKVSGNKLLIAHKGKSSPYRITKERAKVYASLVSANKPCASSYFKGAINAYLSDQIRIPKTTELNNTVKASDGERTQHESRCLCCLSRDFLAKLNQRRIDLEKTDSYPAQWIDWCIQGAQIKPYRTKAQRAPIAACLHDYLSLCGTANDYRSAWRQSVATLMGLHLALGQAQKLINLLSKYCFAYYFAEVDRTWMTSNSWVRAFAIEFDVPIDQIVLRSIHRNYKQYDVTHGIYVNGRGKNAATGFLCNHVTPGVRYSWNQLTCFGCYAEVQEFIKRTSQNEGYIFPMEFEMDALWV
jgi:hypothetical protein